MKIIATLLLIIFSLCSYAQEYKISKDTLFTPSGYKIIEGEMVKVGTGSTNNGDFKFIRVNSASMMKSYSVIRSLANDANAFPREKSGQNFKVIKLEKRGNEKRGYVMYLVLGGLVRYEVDIANAIEYGEILIPIEFRKTNSKTSSADELKKYKELFDSGAITKEEYEAKKKQLLGL